MAALTLHLLVHAHLNVCVCMFGMGESFYCSHALLSVYLLGKPQQDYDEPMQMMESVSVLGGLTRVFD